MARLLCIETATHLCSVAVCIDGRSIVSRDAEDHDGFIHAERLNVLVDEAMKECALAMRDLDAVAVGIGPGSYTGLRIGLSAAKGFCYGLGIPIIGIGTLETLVQAVHGSGLRIPADPALHPMVDARRMEVFTRSFDPAGLPADDVRAQVLDEQWIAALDPGHPHVVFGDGADKATELWKAHPTIVHVPGMKPWAMSMALPATERLTRRRFDDLAYLVPMYGKDPAMRPRSPGEGGREVPSV